MRTRAVVALGIGQCVNWGVLYYAFAVLVVPIQRELGVATWVVTGAFSLALLMSAALAPTIGRWGDRDRGGVVMQAGGFGAAALLAAWTLMPGVPALYVVWAGLGLCMAATLYEPAFVIVGRAHADPAQRLRALAAVTLFGGLASTPVSSRHRVPGRRGRMAWCCPGAGCTWSGRPRSSPAYSSSAIWPLRRRRRRLRCSCLVRRRPEPMQRFVPHRGHVRPRELCERRVHGQPDSGVGRAGDQSGNRRDARRADRPDAVARTCAHDERGVRGVTGPAAVGQPAASGPRSRDGVARRFGVRGGRRDHAVRAWRRPHHPRAPPSRPDTLQPQEWKVT